MVMEQSLLIRVYLAGPEVFLINAKEMREQKKSLCRKYGFEGVFPLDTEIETAGKCPREIGLCISQVNEDLIKNCEALIANITPFRGPSADVGTAYEMGFAHGLGKKVLAYSNIKTSFTERTIKALKGQVQRSEDGKLRDAQAMFIEELSLTDNLMIDGCVSDINKCVIVEEAPTGELFTFLGGFEKALGQLKLCLASK